MLCLGACGSNSLVIGGDPEAEALSSAGTGGSDAAAAGSSGSNALGSDAGTAGAGGSSGSGITIPPASSSYPWVPWAQGVGYATYCPDDPAGKGFTCWNHDADGSRACEDDGDPYCNACSCRVSCESAANCPSSGNGQAVDCLGSEEVARSCFVLCGEGGSCPGGMTCSNHPVLGRAVCVWVIDDETWQGQPK